MSGGEPIAGSSGSRRGQKLPRWGGLGNTEPGDFRKRAYRSSRCFFTEVNFAYRSSYPKTGVRKYPTGPNVGEGRVLGWGGSGARRCVLPGGGGSVGKTGREEGEYRSSHIRPVFARPGLLLKPVCRANGIGSRRGRKLASRGGLGNTEPVDLRKRTYRSSRCFSTEMNFFMFSPEFYRRRFCCCCCAVREGPVGGWVVA